MEAAVIVVVITVVVVQLAEAVELALLEREIAV